MTMKLKKMVTVDATLGDVIDYLRTRLQIGRFRPGDHVRAIKLPTPVGNAMMGNFIAVAAPLLLDKGQDCVVAQCDRSDDTVLVLFMRKDDIVASQWVRAGELELIARIPLEWTPSDAAQDAAAVAEQAMVEHSQNVVAFDKSGRQQQED